MNRINAYIRTQFSSHFSFALYRLQKRHFFMEIGLTTMTVKKINKNKVYHFIYEQKITSKYQIVQNLQMGLSTVEQNLKEPEEEGLIERNGSFESTGRRKAQMIQIIPTARTTIGIEVLKDLVQMTAVNL